ncbi:MAG: cytochrome c [Devosia sp.]|uniref:c-type cytochrome n=1 Tax=Devosia sp. TaxID=1871048 RepID=UPI001AC03E7F|nr:cytochrome c [Devosia sp.]MBN9310332.1 cytochrome c [Devosia sp.]MBN9317220.1 cytochrome c [Devosia sp.]
MRSLLFALLIISGLVTATGYGFLVSARSGGTETPGRALYVTNCAGCHGVSLEGQPDWMKRLPSGRLPAPPHDETGHTWHHSDKQLFTIVKSGLSSIAPGYESDMPVFEGVLSDEQITEVLDYIKSTWPDRARAYQADRSKADPM